MAKNQQRFEGQELAPMEPWRPEYAPQAISSTRHPASTIVAFVLAAGFGLSIGGALASQSGILPPLGGTDAAAVADPSTDPIAEATPDPSLAPAPTDMPAVDPAPSTDPVVIPPPAGGGSGDEDGDDDGEGDDDDGDDDHEEGDDD